MLARDHEALDVILAPWLGVAGAIDLVEGSSIDRKGEFQGSVLPMTFEQLSESAAGDAPQVTSANYAGWNSIVFTASAGADAGRLDLVFAAVRLADGLHVGSLAKAQS